MRDKMVVLGLLFSVLAAPALAGVPAAGGTPAGPSLITQLLFFLPLILIFYFLLFRPQQQRAKKHAAMIAGIKRGDTVITSGGLIGKVSKVADTELTVDLAENVRVRVIRSMVIEVRNKAEPVPAND